MSPPTDHPAGRSAPPEPAGGGAEAASPPAFASYAPARQGVLARTRHDVGRTLTAWGWPAERTETVLLLVSELVTNAHRHAGTPADVELRAHSGGLRLIVRDRDPTPPRRRTPDGDGGGGFGLHLMDSLAQRWGVETRPGGKSVWADIAK